MLYDEGVCKEKNEAEGSNTGSWIWKIALWAINDALFLAHVWDFFRKKVLF